MRKLKVVVVVVLSMVLMASFSFAQERGSAKEAKALLDKAVALIKAEGEKAYPKLQDKNGPFVVKDLYVYVATMDNATVKVHPHAPGMVGKSWLTLKDANGKAFVKELVDGAAKSGKGSVDYSWSDPKTKKVEAKSAYYERVGNVVAVSGYYK
ncbi:MAG TPA: cache domain-containing protein [Smithellaceae bacterium]|nr:cache domain-containing protein [Smithellaceae bacterium]HQM45631.1 cache domain-containing protein [Smithellaceae bacterium]